MIGERHQITIQMDEKGQVSVGGPIGNKVLCYGMLAVAHDAIKDFNDQQAVNKSPIDIVSGRSLEGVPLNGRNNGR